MFISEETVNRVRDASDIVEVVSEFIPALKRAGKDYKALCPFHQEKSPSFMVSPAKGIFHCFGCGVGGDAFKFVMEMEHCSYPEAIRKLAEKKGIPILEGGASFGVSPNLQKKKRLLDILKRASQFYHKTLLDSKEALEALNYLLQKRGLRSETIEKFELGWAPQGGHALLDVALKSGISELELEEGGLAKRYQDSQKWVDHFRGRILFPIFDNKGQVIGFGGRILESTKFREGEAPPKYINSPETVVFQKGKNLYGYYQGARDLRSNNRAVIVEGYMDVIGCHQAGVGEAVAPLGTALTSDQCLLLKRSVENITLLFDSDAAGNQATSRGAELLLEYGFMPIVAQLPKDIDSDEYLQTHSVEEFKNLLQNSKTIFDFRCNLVLSLNSTLPPLLAKSMAAKAVLPLLLKVEDLILRSQMIQFVAGKLGLKEEAIHSELKKLQTGERRNINSPSKAVENKIIPQHELLSLEEELLASAVRNIECRKLLLKDLKCEDFSTHEPAFDCFKKLSEIELEQNIGSILSGLSESSAQWLRNALFRQIEHSEPEKIFASLLERMQGRVKLMEMGSLEQEIIMESNRGGKISSDKNSRYQQLTRDLKGTILKKIKE